VNFLVGHDRGLSVAFRTDAGESRGEAAGASRRASSRRTALGGLLALALVALGISVGPLLGRAGAQDFALPDVAVIPPTDASARPDASRPTVGTAAPAVATPAVATPAVATPASSLPAPGTADEAFDLRAKQIEEQVNDLKEKIFRTKERLMQLNEVILGKGGGINSGAKLVLEHRNELGSSYELVGAVYTLDGSPQFVKVDETGEFNEIEQVEIFGQRVVPGPHSLAVQYELRGNGYGVFSYLEGIRLKVQGSYKFDVDSGQITTVTAVVHEKDGITLEFKDKPTVRFNKIERKELREKDAAPPAVSDASSAGRTGP
jgi:hypothetical protein